VQGLCGKIPAVWSPQKIWIFTAAAALLLVACSAGGNRLAPVDLNGQWQGLATGGMESVEITLALKVDTDGVAEADIFIPSIPEIEEASGWGRVEGSSLSLVLIDAMGGCVFFTGVVDEIGAEMTGEIAVSDDKNILTFSIFRQ